MLLTILIVNAINLITITCAFIFGWSKIFEVAGDMSASLKGVVMQIANVEEAIAQSSLSVPCSCDGELSPLNPDLLFVPTKTGVATTPTPAAVVAQPDAQARVITHADSPRIVNQ